jgi:dolichyl-phosphate beta-glucosyltransferase
MSKVCLIIPCYNEERRLGKDDFEQFLSVHPDYDLLFVNDGSTDRTESVLASFANQLPNAFILNLKENRGKAEAVRAGFLQAIHSGDYQYIGYLDADLATPLSEMVRMKEMLEKNPPLKIILGSRWKRLGAQINRNLMRHYLGRVFATVVSYMFSIEVYDTQCGAKLLVNKDLDKIFRESFISSWFFDIEILLRLIGENRDKPIDAYGAEVALKQWMEVSGSRIRIIDFLQAPFELLKIKKHYRTIFTGK